MSASASYTTHSRKSLDDEQAPTSPTKISNLKQASPIFSKLLMDGDILDTNETLLNITLQGSDEPTFTAILLFYVCARLNQETLIWLVCS